MSRIVVAGGAGFVGSHVCDALVARGDDVLCVDNLITGKLANIDHLREVENFDFMQHDISTEIDVPGNVDAVMHLASPASPKDFTKLPIQILKVGGLGSHNLLGLAKAKDARFFLASTSEVYGDPAVHPQPESYWGNVNPIGNSIGAYDESKRFAEAITMAYHRMHDLDVRIVRIFNTYGPRMRPDDGRVVTNFLVQPGTRRRFRSPSTATAPKPGASATSPIRWQVTLPCSMATSPGRATLATTPSSPCSSWPKS